MATLEEVGEVVTAELRERVERLVSAVEDEAADFAETALLADAVGDLAGRIGEIFSELERTLVPGLQGAAGPEPKGDGSRPPRSEQSQGEQRQYQQSQPNGSPVAEKTKEELLEQAREANIGGRSSMSKEELAEAVEAEESLTKEKLLERAREAGIEGRSSMTKEDLRKALHDTAA